MEAQTEEQRLRSIREEKRCFDELILPTLDELKKLLEQEIARHKNGGHPYDTALRFEILNVCSALYDFASSYTKNKSYQTLYPRYNVVFMVDEVVQLNNQVIKQVRDRLFNSVYHQEDTSRRYDFASLNLMFSKNVEHAKLVSYSDFDLESIIDDMVSTDSFSEVINSDDREEVARHYEEVIDQWTKGFCYIDTALISSLLGVTVLIQDILLDVGTIIEICREKIFHDYQEAALKGENVLYLELVEQIEPAFRNRLFNNEYDLFVYDNRMRLDRELSREIRRHAHKTVMDEINDVDKAQYLEAMLTRMEGNVFGKIWLTNENMETRLEAPMTELFFDALPKEEKELTDFFELWYKVVAVREMLGENLKPSVTPAITDDKKPKRKDIMAQALEQLKEIISGLIKDGKNTPKDLMRPYRAALLAQVIPPMTCADFNKFFGCEIGGSSFSGWSYDREALKKGKKRTVGYYSEEELSYYVSIFEALKEK